MALTSVVDECCRDSRGQPYPPPPTLKRSALAGSPAVTRLPEVPSLKGLGLWQGKALDRSRANPFAADYNATVAVCALWDGQSTREALHEWLEHHRCDM